MVEWKEMALKPLEKIVLRRILWIQVERIRRLEKIMTKNLKTTVMGCLAAAAAIIDATMAQIDGVAATEPNWGLVVATVITAVGLILAKDGK